MAIGNNKGNGNKLFIAKIKTQDKDKKDVSPHFAFSEKVDGKWKVTQDANSVSGDLVKIELDSGEWEGNEYDIVKLTLRDNVANEDYLLDLRLSFLTRNLFNSIVNLNTFENLNISLYERKGADNKTYAAVALRQNDELVKWRFDLEEIPKVNKVTVGKKTMSDFSEVDGFFLKHLEELAAKVNKNGRSSKPKQKDVSQPVDDADLPAEVQLENGLPEDEIPF